MYSAEEMIGTSKSARAKADNVADSVEDGGALSLQLNVTTLGWLRSFCPMVSAESLYRLSVVELGEPCSQKSQHWYPESIIMPAASACR